MGQVEDWKNGSVRAKVDSSDIMNLSFSKDFYGNKQNVQFSIVNIFFLGNDL